MLNWYPSLYLGESVKHKSRQLRFQLNRRKPVKDIWLITLASNGRDALDLVSSTYLIQPLFAEQLPMVIGLAKGRAEAIDVVTEMTEACYAETGDADLRSWLLRVAVNRAKDLLRSASRRRNVPFEDAAAEQAIPSEESRALFRAVGELPEAYRIVIHLHYYEDYPVREIARVLRLPQATVKTRLFRGRELLKKALKEESP